MLWVLKLIAKLNRTTTVLSNKADELQSKTVNLVVNNASRAFERGEENLHAEVAAAQHHLRYVRNRQQDELHRLSDKYHGTISKITAIAAKGSAK